MHDPHTCTAIIHVLQDKVQAAERILESVKSGAGVSLGVTAAAVVGVTGAGLSSSSLKAMVEQYSDMARVYIELAAMPTPADSSSMALPGKV